MNGKTTFGLKASILAATSRQSTLGELKFRNCANEFDTAREADAAVQKEKEHSGKKTIASAERGV